MKVFLLALGYVAVIEGLVPLLSGVRRWQEMLAKVSLMPENVIRTTAFAAVCIGLAVVWAAMELL